MVHVAGLGSLGWMRYWGLLPFPSPCQTHPPTHLPTINNSTLKLTRLLPKLTQTGFQSYGQKNYAVWEKCWTSGSTIHNQARNWRNNGWWAESGESWVSVKLGINCILSLTHHSLPTSLKDGTSHKPKVFGLTFAISANTDYDVEMIMMMCTFSCQFSPTQKRSVCTSLRTFISSQ